MRTLGLGLLAILTTTFALLSNGAPVAAEPTDKEKTEMAAKVYTLLKDKCASCHGADAKKVMGKKGTLNYILDYDKLISEKLIDTKSPEKSELYTEISEGNMPRELDKDGKPKTKKKLAQVEIDLVLNWIKAGAPKWAQPSSEALFVLKGDGLSGVNGVAFSPDGKWILTGNGDECARIWDSGTGKEILKNEDDLVCAVAFSPDGKSFLTGNWFRKSSRLWDAKTGKEIREFGGHQAPVLSVAFSPDGKQVLSAGQDKIAILWELSTGEAIETFEGHTDFIYTAKFSPDGKSIVTASQDKTARIWDVESGTETRKLEGHTKPVQSAAFSPDGKSVLTGSTDNIAKLWDASNGKEIRSFEGHTLGLLSVAFSRDGKLILTGSADKTARLWDCASGKEIRKFEGHTGKILSVAFSPDGKKIATGSEDTTARIWATEPKGK